MGLWWNSVRRWWNGVGRWWNGVRRWWNGVGRWWNGVRRWWNGVGRWWWKVKGGPCDFLKIKILPRSRPKLPIFWNWIPKNIPDQLKCVGFQKSKGVLNHSTLLGKMFQIVKGPQFQNFTLKCCFYFDTVPQTLLSVYPKISKQFCFSNIFLTCVFWKLRIDKRIPTYFFLWPKTMFPILGT